MFVFLQDEWRTRFAWIEALLTMRPSFFPVKALVSTKSLVASCISKTPFFDTSSASDLSGLDQVLNEVQPSALK